MIAIVITWADSEFFELHISEKGELCKILSNTGPICQNMGKNLH